MHITPAGYWRSLPPQRGDREAHDSRIWARPLHFRSVVDTFLHGSPYTLPPAVISNSTARIVSDPDPILLASFIPPARSRGPPVRGGHGMDAMDRDHAMEIIRRVAIAFGAERA